MKSEELKQTAQLRKAIAPLIELLRDEANAEITKRLGSIESKLVELSKRENVINVSPPEVNVNVETPSELTRSIKKLAEPKVIETADPPSAYEPHDQAKTPTFQYSGFVRSNGDFYIQRVAKGEQRYFKGSGNYSDAWEKRDKLKYGYIDEGE